jgi:hypothetical protein
MQAIRVFYLGATNKLPGRFKAECSGGRATIRPIGGEEPEQSRGRAVKALCDKLGWEPPDGRVVSGCLRDGSYAYVFTEKPVQVNNLEPVEAIPEPEADEQGEPESTEAA